LKYKEFSDEFLVAAYRESRLRPGETIRSGEIIDSYPLVFEPGWVVELVRDLGVRGYFTTKGIDSGDRDQPIGLTGRGLRVAEDLIDKGVGISRLDLGDGESFPARETASSVADRLGVPEAVRQSGGMQIPNPIIVARKSPNLPTKTDASSRRFGGRLIDKLHAANWTTWGSLAAVIAALAAVAALFKAG
jgi:hypothetical protein